MFVKNKSGFSLVEILVAISVFTVAAVTASSLLVGIVRADKRTALQMAVYEDARIIMSQLAYEIRNGLVDYEEYYSVCVVQNPTSCGGDVPFGQSETADVWFGINYGVYGSRFFNPGQSQNAPSPAENPLDLGLECSMGLADGYTTGGGIDGCDIIYGLSTDLNTGQNPFVGSVSNFRVANAFCDTNRGILNGAGNCELTPGVTLDKLFLIDITGTKKTMLGRKKITNVGDYAIGKVVMEGFDIDSNGVIDTFSCDNSDFYCYDDALVMAPRMPHLVGPAAAVEPSGVTVATLINDNNITVPQMADLEIAFEDQVDFGDGVTIDNTPLEEVDFMPISPLRTNVTDLKFIIYPIEDPYKGFQERTDEANAEGGHPSITIMATFDLSSAAKAAHPGEFQPFKMQTVVSTALTSTGVVSYPSVTEIRDKDDISGSWVEQILNGLVDSHSVL